jgi:hypothetical protein
MARPRKALLVLVALFVCFLVFHVISLPDSTRSLPDVGPLAPVTSEQNFAPHDPLPSAVSLALDPVTYPSKPDFAPLIRPPGRNYTRTVVMPVTPNDPAQWLDDLPDQTFERALYAVLEPDRTDRLHAPANKGHEAMIYLTYIIDHYDNLSDVTIFMHSHRWAWHNNPIGGMDGAQMFSMLSLDRVNREGYVNMNCQWVPGCKPGFRLKDVLENAVPEITRQEKKEVAASFARLFPETPTPDVIRTPCCAQFAASREMVRATPLTRFIFLRDWLFQTTYTDQISGRVFEQYWHLIFTGLNELCPSMWGCYCDLYGICFRDDAQLEEWFLNNRPKREAEAELMAWTAKNKAIKAATETHNTSLLATLEVPETGRDVFLQSEIDRLNAKLKELWDGAWYRGRDAKFRALSVGREWKEGDGF